MGDNNNIPRGTFGLTITNVIQYLILGLFYIIVTQTNALDPTEIGALSILQFLSEVILLITGLALPNALTKFTSEYLGKNQLEKASSIQKTIMKSVLALSFIVCTLGILFSSQLSHYLFGSSDYSYFISLILVFTFFNNIIILYRSTFQSLFLFGRMAIVTLVLVITTRATAIGLALLSMGLEGVLIGYVIGALIAFLTSIALVRGKLPNTAQNASLKLLLKFSLPLFVTSLTLLILNWADVLIVTMITSDYSLTGVYYITLNSVTVLSILWIPIITTIFPAFSAKHALKKSEDIKAILKIASRYLFYIVVPSSLFLAVVSPTALTFFYGSNYASGAIVLSILSVNSIIIALYALFTMSLTAMGKTTQILKINLILAILTITLLLATVPFLQTVGAATTRLVAQIIGLTLAFHILRKWIPVKIDKEALWKSTIASIAIIPFLLILETTISKNLTITQTLLIEATISLAVYTLSLRLIKALRPQDFELLKEALPGPLTRLVSLAEKIVT